MCPSSPSKRGDAKTRLLVHGTDEWLGPCHRPRLLEVRARRQAACVIQRTLVRPRQLRAAWRAELESRRAHAEAAYRYRATLVDHALRIADMLLLAEFYGGFSRG